MKLADLRKLEPGTYLAAKVGYGAPKRVCLVGVGFVTGAYSFDRRYRLAPEGDSVLVGVSWLAEEWSRASLVPGAVLGLWEPYAAERAKMRAAEGAAREAGHVAREDRARRMRESAAALGVTVDSHDDGRVVVLSLAEFEALAARVASARGADLPGGCDLARGGAG